MLVPIKASWPTFGVSIVSDGWTDPARHPIINFMVSSLNGPVFLKAVDTLGEYKDAQFMGELFIRVVEEVGVDSCVQIITDNAPVCKAAGMIVEAKYPQVFWTPCIVHSLNVAIKSIASDVLWIGSIIEDARHIHSFVQNHTNALTIYKEYTNLSLLKIVDTQFASSFCWDYGHHISPQWYDIVHFGPKPSWVCFWASPQKASYQWRYLFIHIYP